MPPSAGNGAVPSDPGLCRQREVLESDLPFVAFWLASIALFLYQQWWLAALAGVLASLAAYQAVVLASIAGVVSPHREEAEPSRLDGSARGALDHRGLAGLRARHQRRAARWSARRLYADLQSPSSRAETEERGGSNGPYGMALFPGVVAGYVLARPALGANRRRGSDGRRGVGRPESVVLDLLRLGSLVMLSCLAVAERIPVFVRGPIFSRPLLGKNLFAGSQRYLLPVVLPVSILVARSLSGRWLKWGAAAQAILSIGLDDT